MSKSTIESRTLARAAEVLGGAPKLAKYLRVPLADLARWLSAEEKAPNLYFLRAVDVVLNQHSIEPSGEPAVLGQAFLPEGRKETP